MRKISYFALIFSLFLSLHIAASEASQQLIETIPSQGTIHYQSFDSSPSPLPTPSPSPTPTAPSSGVSNAENLANIPDGFQDQIDGWDYITLDYSVTHNGNPSIRLDADYSGRDTRECNGYWYNINPGDRVFFGVWCKTSNYPDDYPFTGGFIGIDLWGGEWGNLHVVDGQPHNFEFVNGEWRSGDGGPQMSSFGNPLVSQFMVPNNNDWTWLYLDIVIPDTYYTISAWGEPVNGTIEGIIPWFGARYLHDNNEVWFADAVLYINP